MTQKPLEIRHYPIAASIRAIDPDARTVELAFSSEAPVDRTFGIEILDHGPAAARLDRLNGGAPLLVNHDPADQVGVVESARVDPDRVGRAVVRFSRSSRAHEIWQDVMDGIRRLVSVGYLAHKTTGSGGAYRVVDWEPLELSLVAVPADSSVGVGRDFSLQNGDIAMSDDVRSDTVAPAPPVIEINSQLETARMAERERCVKIRKIGQQFGFPEVAERHIESGSTVEDFMGAVVAIRYAGKSAPKPLDHLDLPKKDAQTYSIRKALVAQMTRDWSKAGLELEVSRTLEDKYGRQARGVFLPSDIWTRTTASVLDDTAGGFLVATQTLANQFIDTLRARSVCLNLGATVLSDLVGDVSIPKKTSSATFYWVAEDTAPTEGAVAFGAINLRPHTVAGYVPITRKLLLQSSPSIEQLIRDDLITGCSLAIDNAIIDGAGVGGEPCGIVNTVGVNTVAVNSNSAPTWLEIIAFESAVAADNALAGSLAYLTTPTMRGTLKGTDKFSSAGAPVWTEGGTVNGYRADVSTQVTADMIIFGNWSEAVVGMWGMMDVVADEATKASTGGLVIRVFQDIDVGLRHPDAFAIAT